MLEHRRKTEIVDLDTLMSSNKSQIRIFDSYQILGLSYYSPRHEIIAPPLWYVYHDWGGYRLSDH